MPRTKWNNSLVWHTATALPTPLSFPPAPHAARASLSTAVRILADRIAGFNGDSFGRHFGRYARPAANFSDSGNHPEPHGNAQQRPQRDRTIAAGDRPGGARRTPRIDHVHPGGSGAVE